MRCFSGEKKQKQQQYSLATIVVFAGKFVMLGIQSLSLYLLILRFARTLKAEKVSDGDNAKGERECEQVRACKRLGRRVLSGSASAVERELPDGRGSSFL